MNAPKLNFELFQDIGFSLDRWEYKGDYQRAEETSNGLLKQAFQSGLPDSDAQFGSGIIRFLQGNFQQATEVFRAIEEGSEASPERFLLAFVWRVSALKWSYEIFPGWVAGYPSDLSPRWNAMEEEVRAGKRWDQLRTRVQDPMYLAEAAYIRLMIGGHHLRRSRAASKPDPQSSTLLAAFVRDVQILAESSYFKYHCPSLRASLFLRIADVIRLTGDRVAAHQWWNEADAAYKAVRDTAGEAACQLMLADWFSEPTGILETLGVALGIQSSDSYRPGIPNDVQQPHPSSDLDKSTRAVERADTLYRAGNSTRGRAACAIRSAYIAAKRSDFRLAWELASRGYLDFEKSGDVIGKWTAAVHRIVYQLTLSGQEDHELATKLAEWGRGEGSVSLTIGWGLLLRRLAQDWVRTGNYDRGLAGYRLAETIFTGVPAAGEMLNTVLDQAETFSLAGDDQSQRVLLEKARSSLDSVRDQIPYTVALHLEMSIESQLLNNYISVLDDDALYDQARRLELRAEHSVSEAGQWDLDTFSGFEAPMREARPFTEEEQAAYEGACQFLEGQQARYIAAVADILSVCYRAVQHRQKGREYLAGNLFNRALEIADNLPSPQCHYHRSVVLYHSGQFAQSLESVRKLAACVLGGEVDDLFATRQTFVSKVGDPHALKQLHDHYQFRSIAGLFTATGSAVDARWCIGQIAEIAGPDWWKQMGHPWNGLSLLGEIEELEGNLASALGYYGRALQSFEATYNLLRADELRMGLRADKEIVNTCLRAVQATLKIKSICEAKTDLAAAQTLANLAFCLAQKAKSRGFAEALVSRLNDAAAAEVFSEEELVSNQVSADGATPSAKNRKQEVGFGYIHEDIYRECYESGQIKLADVCSHIPSGTVLLEYMLLSRSITAWAITNKGMIRHSVSSVDLTECRALIEIVRGDLSNPEAPPISAAGKRLSQLLLEPFRAIITAFKKIWIVPHVDLYKIPLHGLPWNGSYLGLSHAITYIPSTQLFSKPSLPDKGPGTFVAVGDPYGSMLKNVQLDSLPHAALEAQTLKHLYEKSVVLTGKKATRTRVLAALRKAGIVHFATHGEFGAIPESSRLLLAEGNYLSARDLTDLPIQAELVVLNCCQLGRVGPTRGNDVLGFWRSLMLCDVRFVVAALWDIKDISSRILMVRFHQLLQCGTPPAEALHIAQCWLAGLAQEEISRWSSSTADLSGDRPFSHPYYWAPHVLLGSKHVTLSKHLR